nr:GSU2403 family nucleotidyltransferase fold protein [Burkholderia sp. BDU5]
MSSFAEFSRLALTLEPWRQHIVFVGGWAFRLYGYEPRAYTADHKPIFTQDADVAYDKRELIEGNIKTALEGAGFTEQPNLAGGFRPPAMRYNLDGDENGFYAEFLTPLTGSCTERYADFLRRQNTAVRPKLTTWLSCNVRYQTVIDHDRWQTVGHQ